MRTEFQVPTFELQRAVREKFGCGSSFIGAVPVIDAHADMQRLVMVSVLSLIGHSTAKRCYAWWNGAGTGTGPFALVLEAGGIASPEAAVAAGCTQAA